MANIDLGGLLRTLTSDYETTRAEKQKRYAEGKGILEGVVEQFGPEYLKGEEKKQLAAMEQGMVGRGLGGTTRPAAVGTGIKADIRDRATKARTGAMTNVAQYMAGFQDIYPQPGTLAHLATGGFSGLLQEELAKAAGGPLAPAQVDKFGLGGTTGGTTGARGMAAVSGGGGGGGWGQDRSSGGGGGGGDTTVSSNWSPSGLPPITGMGAATYGVNGGLDSPSDTSGFQPGWKSNMSAEELRAEYVKLRDIVGDSPIKSPEQQALMPQVQALYNAYIQASQTSSQSRGTGTISGPKGTVSF